MQLGSFAGLGCLASSGRFVEVATAVAAVVDVPPLPSDFAAHVIWLVAAATQIVDLHLKGPSSAKYGLT